jgi:hypothetical protein
VSGSLTAARGSCHGYSIRAGFDFRTLRSGGGTPLHVREESDLDAVGELVATWEARPGNPFHGRLLRDGAGYAFWTSDAGWFVIDPEQASIIVSTGVDPLRRELRMFGVPTALCTFAQGDISIHASAVEIDGNGVLLAAPSRYGKTTLAAAFARAGHRFLSEDTSRCSVDKGPAVFPGPAVLRLRSDVANSIDIVGSSHASDPDGRVPVILDPAERGNGRAVPLRAVIFLGEGAGQPVLTPVEATVALRDVFALTFRLPIDSYRAATFARVAQLVTGVETLRLRRPMTIESLGEVIAVIEEHVTRSNVR